MFVNDKIFINKRQHYTYVIKYTKIIPHNAAKGVKELIEELKNKSMNS